jgi:hypothetical protein
MAVSPLFQLIDQVGGYPLPIPAITAIMAIPAMDLCV